VAEPHPTPVVDLWTKLEADARDLQKERGVSLFQTGVQQGVTAVAASVVGQRPGDRCQAHQEAQSQRQHQRSHPQEATVVVSAMVVGILAHRSFQEEALLEVAVALRHASSPEVLEAIPRRLQAAARLDP